MKTIVEPMNYLNAFNLVDFTLFNTRTADSHGCVTNLCFSYHGTNLILVNKKEFYDNTYYPFNSYTPTTWTDTMQYYVNKYSKVRLFGYDQVGYYINGGSNLAYTATIDQITTLDGYTCISLVDGSIEGYSDKNTNSTYPALSPTIVSTNVGTTSFSVTATSTDGYNFYPDETTSFNLYQIQGIDCPILNWYNEETSSYFYPTFGGCAVLKLTINVNNVKGYANNVWTSLGSNFNGTLYFTIYPDNVSSVFCSLSNGDNRCIGGSSYPVLSLKQEEMSYGIISKIRSSSYYTYSKLQISGTIKPYLCYSWDESKIISSGSNILPCIGYGCVIPDYGLPYFIEFFN